MYQPRFITTISVIHSNSFRKLTLEKIIIKNVLYPTGFIRLTNYFYLTLHYVFTIQIKTPT